MHAALTTEEQKATHGLRREKRAMTPEQQQTQNQWQSCNRSLQSVPCSLIIQM